MPLLHRVWMHRVRLATHTVPRIRRGIILQTPAVFERAETKPDTRFDQHTLEETNTDRKDPRFAQFVTAYQTEQLLKDGNANSNSSIKKLAHAIKVNATSLPQVMAKLDHQHYRSLLVALMNYNYRFDIADREFNMKFIRELAHGSAEDYQTFVKYASKGITSLYNHSMAGFTLKQLIIDRSDTTTAWLLDAYLQRLLKENNIGFTSLEDLAQMESFHTFLCLVNEFKLRRNQMPLLSNQALVDSSIVSVLNRILNYGDPHSLEPYLKVLYRYLNSNSSPPANTIGRINHMFLRFLSSMEDVSLELITSYVLGLFPQSQQTLEDIGILKLTSHGLKPQIRPELCLQDKPASDSIIAMIYERVLSTWPVTAGPANKLHTRKLFATYLDYAKTHSLRSSSVLDEFILHCLNLGKPRLGATLLDRYLESFDASTVRSKTVSQLLARLAYVDVTRACVLLNQLRSSCNFNADAYMAVAEVLLRLGETEDAHEYYNYVCKYPHLSRHLKPKHMALIQLEGWKAPSNETSNLGMPEWLVAEPFSVDKVLN